MGCVRLLCHCWARVGAREPDCSCFIELHRRDPCFETDGLPKGEPVGYVIQVSKDFGLLGITVRPTPFLLQFVREGIRVIKALDVTARARIAIPEPCAADPVGRLDAAYPQPELAHPIGCIKPAETRADDQDVDALALGFPT